MYRFLAALAVLIALLSGEAQAANLACWIKRPGGQIDSQVGVGQIRALLWSTAAVTGPDGCITTTTAAGETSGFLQAGGRLVSFTLEPQVGGTDTAAQADLFCCTQPSLNACLPLLWDTDADGVVDDNTLDATNAMKRATPAFMGCPWVYLDPTINPASGTAEVTAVGMSQGDH